MPDQISILSAYGSETETRETCGIPSPKPLPFVSVFQVAGQHVQQAALDWIPMATVLTPDNSLMDFVFAERYEART